MNKELWIARAKELGIDELEIYEMLQEERSLSWYEGKMDSFTTSRVLGTSLRAIVGEKQSEMALEQAEDASMDEILGSLLSQAQAVNSSDVSALRAPEPGIPSGTGGEDPRVRPADFPGRIRFLAGQRRNQNDPEFPRPVRGRKEHGPDRHGGSRGEGGKRNQDRI